MDREVFRLDASGVCVLGPKERFSVEFDTSILIFGPVVCFLMF